MKNGFNYNSLAFIRRYYHIPASRRLSWALIAETVHGKTEIRLGVVFTDSPYLYIDVAMRRFFTERGGAVSRKAFPAGAYIAPRRVCIQDSRRFVEAYAAKLYPRYLFYVDIFA